MGLLQYCGKVQLSLPLLILTNLVINGYSQTGSPARTAQSPLVALASLIFRISRGQSSERELLGVMHFSIRESRKNPQVCFETFNPNVYNSNLD